MNSPILSYLSSYGIDPAYIMIGLLVLILLLYKAIVFLYLFYRFGYAIIRYCGLVFSPTT